MNEHLKSIRRIKLVLVFLLITIIQNVFSQTVENLTSELKMLGFENVRTLVSNENYYVSVENNVYRWDPLAIAKALDLTAGCASDVAQLHLVLLEKGIPFFVVEVNAALWKNFRNGTLDKSQIVSNLIVSWETGETWNKLKEIEPVNSNKGKIDIVVYPQFYYENTRLSKIYEVQLNIAPLADFSLWRGNKFSGQVIFPIFNELGYEGDFIRPGYVTLSQDFRFPKQWIGTFSAGNFSNSRYGMEMYIWHPFENGNWKAEFKAGLTGFSHFLDYRWTNGSLNTLTWSTSLSYYYQRFNMVLKAGAAQYIYNDMGLFATCTRYFGETVVGFYAQLNEHNLNGGFQVSIPFPLNKRSNRKQVRITIPENLDFGYNSGTELYYGQKFSTNPAENQIKFLSFTSLIKDEILILKN